LNRGELIYPNPVSDKFTFEYKLDVATIVDISIFNSKGVLVQNKKMKQEIGHFFQKFDVSDLPAGIYVLKSLINEKIINRKFTVVK
jgi:Secretion system C-terminal sorting domain